MIEGAAPGELEGVLQRCLPPGVGVAVWSDLLGPAELGRVEGEAVARAVAKRRLEFARGRTCARVALRRAGYDAGGGHVARSFVEIPMGPSREPRWPDGFTGSITHCEGLVAAVAASTTVVEGIGIDAEVDKALPAEVMAAVLTPEERRAPTPDSIVHFSAKEAIHKVLFPLIGVWLDFLDVSLMIDASAGRFRARRAAEAEVTTPELERIVGRYVRTGAFVITAATVSARAEGERTPTATPQPS